MKLEELYLHNNALRYIHLDTFSEHFTPNLKVINFANNSISFLNENGHLKDGVPDYEGTGKRSPLKDCKKLEKINLSHNNITHLFSDWTDRMSNLKLLNLSHNSITKFEILPFMASDNCEIDLRYNKISEVTDTEKLFNQESKTDDRHYTWHLEGNPYKCDCQNYHVFRRLGEQWDPKVREVRSYASVARMSRTVTH